MLEKFEELLKALKAQVALPNIKANMPKAPKMPNAPAAPKLPGLPSATKKNPVKQAEQTQNKDIKDMKMREAQEQLNVNKSTGQWSIQKSGYKGYTEEDNARRKARNLSTSDVNFDTMQRTKKWSAPTKSAQAQKEIDKFNRKSPVKEWSKEHGWHFKDKKGNVIPA